LARPAQALDGRRVTDRAAAFVALTERHLDAAYRLAGVILGDAGEAEDAAHDAALAAWRSRDLLRDEARFEPWFTRIVVNECRDRLRARRRSRVTEVIAEPPVDPAFAHPRGSDPLVELATRDAIGRALRVLEPDELIVVALRFYRDLTVDAIAERLGIPSGTVKSRLNGAMSHLRAAIEAGEVTP
jgi:RNA polymerase sigma-70 factor, ECF subfamily